MKVILRATLATLAMLTLLGSASASPVSCVPPPLPVTTPATGVSASAATLRGSIDPNGCATTWSFQYGTTGSYETATAMVSAGAGTSSKPVAARITGLAAKTVYHFRLVASNAAGTTAGPDQTFQTAVSCGPGGALPSITDTKATRVTEFAATLQALVNPNGCTTSYQFAYGKTTAYGRRTPIVHLASKTNPISASEAIGGLLPNTKYHFKLIAYSAGGKAAGPGLTFRTKLGAVVRIARGPAYLDESFVAGIRVACVHGRGGCYGAVKIFWKRQVIGQHRFFLRRRKTRVILVGLDRLGRNLFRTNRTLRVGVVARLKYYEAKSSLMLVRQFSITS